MKRLHKMTDDEGKGSIIRTGLGSRPCVFFWEGVVGRRGYHKVSSLTSRSDIFKSFLPTCFEISQA